MQLKYSLFFHFLKKLKKNMQMKNSSIGGDWYQYCDVVFTPYKDLIGTEILPKSHIFYKLLKDDVTFLQTMSEDDISQKVKFSLNPDVKLYIQSLGHIVGASVLPFLR